MSQLPRISVITATLNSTRTLTMCLGSIRAQNYPQDLVEILVVDGGSTDDTREIAGRFNCRVVDNPRVEPMTAKLIGLREASHDLIMYLDSDEVIESTESLIRRVRAFRENPGVAMVFFSGFVNPVDASFAAHYINEFGDPFSMYFYRLSKDLRFFLSTMRKRQRVVRETDDYVVFSLEDGPQPIMTTEACGSCIDRAFFRKHFHHLFDKPWGSTLFFYHMQEITTEFIIVKGDCIRHYSADRWQTFLRKIRWRIVNNIFFKSDMGASGFGTRVSFDSKFQNFKKYFFIPYAFFILPALLDSLVLSWTRRDPKYILHLPLTLYTAGQIIVLMTLKIFGYRPPLTSYGSQRVISRN